MKLPRCRECGGSVVVEDGRPPLVVVPLATWTGYKLTNPDEGEPFFPINHEVLKLLGEGYELVTVLPSPPAMSDWKLDKDRPEKPFSNIVGLAILKQRPFR